MKGYSQGFGETEFGITVELAVFGFCFQQGMINVIFKGYAHQGVVDDLEGISNAHMRMITDVEGELVVQDDLCAAVKASGKDRENDEEKQQQHCCCD